MVPMWHQKDHFKYKFKKRVTSYIFFNKYVIFTQNSISRLAVRKTWSCYACMNHPPSSSHQQIFLLGWVTFPLLNGYSFLKCLSHVEWDSPTPVQNTTTLFICIYIYGSFIEGFSWHMWFVFFNSRCDPPVQRRNRNKEVPCRMRKARL